MVSMAAEVVSMVAEAAASTGAAVSMGAVAVAFGAAPREQGFAAEASAADSVAAIQDSEASVAALAVELTVSPAAMAARMGSETEALTRHPRAPLRRTQIPMVIGTALAAARPRPAMA